MWKRILFFSFLILSITAGIWGYAYLLKLKSPKLKPIDIIPDSCWMVLKVNNPISLSTELTQGNLIWESVSVLPSFKGFAKMLQKMNAILLQGKATGLFSEPWYFAWYDTPTSGRWLLSFNLKSTDQEKEILSLFSQYLELKELPQGCKSAVFKDGTIPPLYLKFEKGVIIFSPEVSLIKNGIIAGQQGMLGNNNPFAAAESQCGGAETGTLFFHFPSFKKSAWDFFFSKNASLQAIQSEEEQWVGLDLKLTPTEFSCSSLLATSENSKIKSPKDPPADLSSLFEYLPLKTQTIDCIRRSPFQKGAADSKGFGFDSTLEKDCLENFDNPDDIFGATAALASVNLDDTVRGFGIVEVEDLKAAYDVFICLADSHRLSPLGPLAFRKDNNAFFEKISSGVFKDRFSWFVILKGVLIMSNSERDLQLYLSGLENSPPFSKNENALSFIEKNFMRNLNRLYFSHLPENKKSNSSLFSSNLISNEEVWEKFIRDFEMAGYSLQNLDGRWLLNFHLNFNPRSKTYRNTLWECVLEDSLTRGPWAVRNHKSGENEILCQSAANDLYLISNTGKIIWKKRLAEQILGSPLQIDYFKNDKLQMLFAGESSIYLIDKNGKMVTGFPIHFKVGAGSGLKLLNSNLDSQPEYWVYLKNKSLICMDQNFKLKRDFKTISLEAPLEMPPTVLTFVNRKVVVFSDTLGNVYTVLADGGKTELQAQRIPAESKVFYLNNGKDLAHSFLCYYRAGQSKWSRLSFGGERSEIPCGDVVSITSLSVDTLDEFPPQVLIAEESKARLLDFFGAQKYAFDYSFSPAGKIYPTRMNGQKYLVFWDPTFQTVSFVKQGSHEIISTDVKNSIPPIPFQMISGSEDYLLGAFGNRIFCLRP